MKNIKTFLTASIVGAAVSLNTYAQQVQGFVHQQSEASGYVWPTDEQVLDKLDKWQDQKFGVLFHWGLYSVPGIVESWSICSEDEEWIPRDTTMTYDAYKQWYWGLKDKFNPVNFNPAQWAEVMKDAGMKYMIFTSKHHDGFCMFDSRYTDFSIAHGAFKDNPKKNVARYVFDAFRQEGFMTGCYFSKPDWHCSWYWNPYFATPNRNQNYKKERHPEWWKKYQEFTENQLNELMENYGSFDILWLDGGWVTGDDINLDRILEKARQKHPGLISVDRSIRGRNENYQTPERGIPEKLMASRVGVFRMICRTRAKPVATLWRSFEAMQTIFWVVLVVKRQRTSRAMRVVLLCRRGKLKAMVVYRQSPASSVARASRMASRWNGSGTKTACPPRADGTRG